MAIAGVFIGYLAIKYLAKSRVYALERVKGIEPSLFAWEAKVLPLNDTRMQPIVLACMGLSTLKSLEGAANSASSRRGGDLLSTIDVLQVFRFWLLLT